MGTIVISGSIAYDYIMDYSGDFSDHILQNHTQKLSMSFGIDRLHKLSGGTGHNIAYTHGMLGGDHILLGSVGKDFLIDKICAEYINYEHILKCDDLYTASAYIITDNKNNQITPFYAGAMMRAYEQGLHELNDAQKPEYAIISPNNTQAMMKHLKEAVDMGIQARFDPGQAITFLTPDELREGIGIANTLIVNEYEYELIQHRTGYSNDRLIEILDQVIITKGAAGVDVYTNGSILHIDSIICTNVIDPTGAGDALRGGVLFGLQEGYDMVKSLHIGTLCAWYCIQVYGGQAHQFTKDEFSKKYYDVYGEII